MRKTDFEVIERPGLNKLWGWFGLSYASFLTLPRVLMHEMPDDWQKKMADLLDEFDNTFQSIPLDGFRVQGVKNKKLTKIPTWLLNYRHPDKREILKSKLGITEQDIAETRPEYPYGDN